MTTADSLGSSDPRAQLSMSRSLARRVRREQRASWFPLFVFSLITFLAIPVTRAGHPAGLVCRQSTAVGLPGARVCVAHNSAAYIYWPIALIAAYVLIAAFYLHRAHTRGLGARIRPYVITGLVLAIAVTGASIWAAHTVLTGPYDFLGWHLAGQDVYRVIGPACAIGLALLVLAAIDRSPALVAVTVAYLVIAIGGFDFGWTITQPSRWAFAPHLVTAGSLLLIASAGFALAQRPDRHADSVGT
jgi:hypothetical protein